MSWRCLCGHSAVFTDDRVCDHCGKPILSSVNTTALTVFRKGFNLEMSDDEAKEKYIQLYSGFKTEAIALSNEELLAQIVELQDICATAKLNLTVKQEELRERKAKLTHSQRSWLVTDTKPNPVTSDAINAVKVRKERMSKGDKAIQNMIDAGLDEEFINNARRKFGMQMPDKFTFNKDIPEAKVVSAVSDAVADALEAAAAVKNSNESKAIEAKASASEPFNPFAKK